MRQIHFSAWGAVLLGAAGFLAYSVPGHAQGAAPAGGNAPRSNAPAGNVQRLAIGAELYAGGLPTAEGIVLGGWGSGMAEEDRTYRTVGDSSIKVETNGYYAGARIQYTTPKDITALKSDPYGLLEFVIRFQPGTLKAKRERARQAYGGGSGYGSDSGSGSSSTYPDGSSGNSGDSSSSSGMDTGTGSASYPGAMGDGSTQNISPDTRTIKVVLVCEEGTFVASELPVTLIPATQEGWFVVGVPFVAFRGIDRVPTARLREIRVFGNTQDTFWIGEILTSSDDEPIQVEPLDELEVSKSEAVEFNAVATGGRSPLHYSWDFDDSDGVQEERVGPQVVWVFNKASAEVRGELKPTVVTLTVKDLSGAKQPVVRTARIIVNP